MVIEQNIEFKLRGSGPPGRTCVPITGYFHEKRKIFLVNLQVNYYLLLKYCTRQRTLLSPTWTKSQNLIPKCKILNMFWTSILSTRRIEQFNFFIGFLMIKI